MDNLWCNQTTEAGEDEIYLIVTWHSSGGQYGSFRVPNGHWDLNDGNEPRQVSRFDLWSGAINPGETVDISVFILEEDNGSSDQIVAKAQQVMSVLGPAACATVPASCPYAAAISQVIDFISNLPIHIQDSDDYIGSFSMTVTRGLDGNLYPYYHSVVRCAGFGPWNMVPIGINPNWTMGATFVGDGSSYNARFILHY